MATVAILVSLALLGITILLAFYLHGKLKEWWGSILLLLAFFVPFLSHCWHAIAGEAFIAEQCEVDNNAVLGWTDCVSDSDFYTIVFNSYELTVSIENCILYGLGIYVTLSRSFLKPAVYVLALLLVSGILSSLALIVLPYEQMQWYVVVYNFYNIAMLLFCFIIINNNLPSQPYGPIEETPDAP